jgi:hypothetical protein
VGLSATDVYFCTATAMTHSPSAMNKNEMIDDNSCRILMNAGAGAFPIFYPPT